MVERYIATARLTYINPLYTVTAIVVQMHTSRINVAAAM